PLHPLRIRRSSRSGTGSALAPCRVEGAPHPSISLAKQLLRALAERLLEGADAEVQLSVALDQFRSFRFKSSNVLAELLQARSRCSANRVPLFQFAQSGTVG